MAGKFGDQPYDPYTTGRVPGSLPPNSPWAPPPLFPPGQGPDPVAGGKAGDRDVPPLFAPPPPHAPPFQPPPDSGRPPPVLPWPVYNQGR